MFIEPDTWNGGSIELLVALGLASPARRLNASRAVWQWPALQGPYAVRNVEPDSQAATSATSEGHHYGVATLPGGVAKVAFATSFIEDSDGLWLYAGVPLGSLGTAYSVGAFPFGEPSTKPWELAVYEWLFDLAKHLFATVSFERAVVGWLTAYEVDELAESVLPERRGHGYILANNGVLEYYAPNLKSGLLT